MIGSLFSGIGGLELGLEMAGLGPTAWQVEIDPFTRSILAKHWPNADRSVTDVRQAGAATLSPVDIVCGGFPCQDISSAGTRRGLAGARSGLWYEFARVLAELRPRYAVVENVASGSRKWVDAVRRDLGRLGYESLPIPLEARDVGAPHLRARVFIVAANPNGVLLREQQGMGGGSSGEGSREPGHTGAQGEDLADGNRVGQPSEQASGLHGRHVSHGNDPHGRRVHAFPPGRGDVAGWEEYIRNGGPEPGLRRGSDGLRPGLDRPRLRALGNAVVPQLGEVVGHIIQELGGI